MARAHAVWNAVALAGFGENEQTNLLNHAAIVGTHGTADRMEAQTELLSREGQGLVAEAVRYSLGTDDICDRHLDRKRSIPSLKRYASFQDGWSDLTIESPPGMDLNTSGANTADYTRSWAATATLVIDLVVGEAKMQRAYGCLPSYRAIKDKTIVAYGESAWMQNKDLVIGMLENISL